MRTPRDPQILQAIRYSQAMQRARAVQLTRRGFLGATGVGATALALAACAPAEKKELTPAKDVSASEKTLTWDNWPAYMDEDDAGDYPTLMGFENESGITVTYNVAVDDNNSYYAKVKDQLALGQSIGADTVCLTDWMVARLVRNGYLQELDHANIPNIANLSDSFANPDFDKGRNLSLPWQGGFAGICWNKEKVPGGLKSVDDLWAADLKGRVGVLSEMRDTMGLIMLNQGTDITGEWGDDEFANAMDAFTEQVENGQIRNIKGNAYLNDLQSEDTYAAICWSGDITSLNAQAGDKWEFAIPDAGGTLWNDTFVVPMGATHKANAEAVMNYYYEPEVAAELAAWVNYVTPVNGAKEAMDAIDPELAANQLIFPDEETLSTVHVFRTLTPQEENDYQAQFQKVLLGS
ncbi:spermidine/putrescine ABC transporter substrate-binding protein [Herbiconiux sp. CPCC 205716]|uniref:Spermidine/putrescine ABC transporter substrate-binding protein n=1 Tax=Herbiconiux gentiana TaxID=2970912 RepID=A0ABT2GB12_9MICO|nr:spermidine/putrescine ABC transporter substrate-binding protein [Herbiconiux gentiana]MCS5713392.1 spermidine/putrescine ABC transporter substrate-binding protein [Herbiconiux gentiana]